MNEFSRTSATEQQFPRLWRLIVVALGALILCSCRGPRDGREIRTASSGPGHSALIPHPSSFNLPQSPPALPQAAYTGVPADPAAGGYPPVAAAPTAQYGVPVPYAPAGPWAPPGISQPWPQDEYLADGGDSGLKADVTRDGQVRGLDAQDTIAHYDTLDGRTMVEPSNRVHVYSPRFRAVRQVVSLRENEQLDRSSGVYAPVQPVGHGEVLTAGTNKQNIQTARQVSQKSLTTFRTRQWDGLMSGAIRAGAFQDAFLPYENFTVIRTGKFEAREMTALARGTAAAITWSHVQAVQVVLDQKAAIASVGNQKVETIFTVKEPPAQPKLRLIKVASTQLAEPGDTVDFTLRFDNVGNQPIGNVTIVDNLTTRLEYVAGSAQASVAADFSTQRNPEDSLVLRWEITEPVQPGRGGILRFTCRVR